ncbi:hypothetical protein O1611_g2385 [Lasiodiplodia mahajangana]|uniref:Uncharacterized protein n=1 Tax=Lasiodiplodia mahajangana TaxID=1108764 RepID=A0ACC2JUQ6_9PEZI|nr:hypothetical protein O1611_g2385 [Lasiodiplodia mahajangana]
MAFNPFDLLLDACASPNSYPTKLLRSELFPHALQKYNQLIDERASRVFAKDNESEHWLIRFWDRCDGQQGFPLTPHACGSVGQLKEYLLVNQKDPACRHMKAPIKKVEKALVDMKCDKAEALGSTLSQVPIPSSQINTFGSKTTGCGLSRIFNVAGSSSTLPQKCIIETHAKPGTTRLPHPAASNSNRQLYTAEGPPVSPAGQVDIGKDPFRILEGFKYEDLQYLYHIGSKLHEADMILNLDAGVLLEVINYFKGFVDDPQLPEGLKDGCQAALSTFVRQTTAIVRELEAERTRIATLITLLNDGKALLNSVTQFRDVELNRLSSTRVETMTKDMHQSTLQMETIAARTEKETSSMHTITFATLLFLPGTFVATFLGAGFFQWPDNNRSDQIPNYPIWRPHYFVLFAEISFPLMALTLLFWAGPHIVKQVKAKDPNAQSAALPAYLLGDLLGGGNANNKSEHVKEGVEGNGCLAPYIPIDKLTAYWSHNRIEALLGHREMEVVIPTLKHRFKQIMSILTYIADDSHDYTEYIVPFYMANIDDHSLPLLAHDQSTSPGSRHAQSPFPDDYDGREARVRFLDCQWRFLPLDFNKENGIMDRIYPPRALDPRHVIPVTIEGELSQQQGRGEFIVFKEYDGKRHSAEFISERSAYHSIYNKPSGTSFDLSKHFLAYYGCFQQGDKCVIVTEYANQGSLLDFFRSNGYLPCTKEEAVDLWSDLGDLIKSLALLHKGGKHDSSIHQDIKPANIFVSQFEKSQSRFRFKLGDFGMCSVTPIDENGDTIGRDNGGSRMYSSPEMCRIFRDIPMDGQITWQADIWSFGCVLLDCGVWMALHDRGRTEFRMQRSEEIERRKPVTLRSAGRDMLGDATARLSAQQLQSCFESALRSSALPSPSGSLYRAPSRVGDIQRISHRTPTDLTENTIVAPVGGSQASPPAAPRNTGELAPRARTSNDRVANQTHFQLPSIPRRSTISCREPSYTPFSPFGQYNAPGLRHQSFNRFRRDSTANLELSYIPNTGGARLHTVADVHEWISKHRYDKDAPMPKWLENPVNGLKDRDQCFIFDNSASMIPHWHDVMRTADALIYVLKGVDPDGFEVHMTNPQKTFKRKSYRELFGDRGQFEQCQPRPDSGSCHMETVLSNILERVMEKTLGSSTSMLNCLSSPKIRGVNVYIFTDGVWGSRQPPDILSKEAGGVENVIRTAVQRLQAANKWRTFFSIQFIGFGDNPIGRGRMQFLDDTSNSGWDIVDSTPHNGDVVKMILGATNQDLDNSPHSYDCGSGALVLPQ